MTAPDFKDFLELPLVGILRGTSPDNLPEIIKAVRDGGMRYLEITMNSVAAEDQIRSAIELAEGAITIGAGTVTSREVLDRACSAGASFIVTPGVVPEVIQHCEDLGLPVCPGALTPTEVIKAQGFGPKMIAAVKIFPADALGPNYIRALKGPFPKVRLMPTGGVDLQTLPSFIAAGADAFGIGGPLFQKDRLDARDWTWLKNQVHAYVQSYRSRTSSSAKT